MGALHEGHFSLVKASVSKCDFTVVTIFVNPTQFGPGEDLDQYPRNTQQDVELLQTSGVDVVFAPAVDELYRQGHSTFVDPPSVSRTLEGALRPGHFRGVTTIVFKLLQIIPADIAFFGQKDYQQTCVIRDMVADLNLAVSIQVCPIIRDIDGLAISSRNVYLSVDERQRALALWHSLRRAAEMFRDGETDASTIRSVMVDHLQKAGVTKIDYVTLVDPVTLEAVTKGDATTMALVAAYVGKTRLIDNTRLGSLPDPQ